MTQAEIDRLIEAMEENENRIEEFLDINSRKRIKQAQLTEGLSVRKFFQLIPISIMKQIEAGEYEYFCMQCASHNVLRRLLIGASEEHKREFIEGKIAGVELDKYEKMELIEELDASYRKACIEDKIAGVELDSYAKAILIRTLDYKYQKKCIEGKIAGVKLDNFEKMELLESLDESYRKACIEGKIVGVELDNYEKISLIGILDESYRKACIEDKIVGVKLDNYEKMLLIEKLDEAYQKHCIEGKIFGLELDSISKVKLIKKLGQDYQKNCIEGKIPGLKLDSFGKTEIIKSINDMQYIERCINNEELSEDTRKFFEVYIEISSMDKKEVDAVYKINLPKEITIGMEIENEGEMSKLIQSIFSYADWSAKNDSSLQNGVEIISTILHPTLEDAQKIYIVTDMLNKAGQHASERCGAHIHIGADYLTSVQSYKNLMEIWGNTEEILYAISNEKGTAPRSAVEQYAPPITGKLQAAINLGKIQLTDETELDEFILELQNVQGSRYSGLNLLNINNSKNTIEFRLANGTINPNLWIDNINLFGGIVAVAEELTVTQDKRKQELFSKLTENMSNDEKVSILLELVGVEPKRYEERYRANIGLMQAPECAFAGIEGPTKFTINKIKEMTSSVSALSQQAAIQAIVTENEREQKQQRDGILSVGLE